MPALVETMSYSGRKPWHGIGTTMSDQCTDISEAIKASGLDWTVKKEQLGFQTPDGFIEYTNRFAVVRSSDNAVLGDCGPKYNLLQNDKAFEWFEPFLQKDAFIHTCGALKGGSVVWILAKLNLDPLEIRPNDNVDKYLLLSHSFDGTLSVRIAFTPIRVVCWNTLSMSMRDNNSSRVRIRHSSKMEENMDMVREAVNLAEQSFSVTKDKYKALQNKGVNQNDLRKYFKTIFEIEDDPSTRSLNQLDQLEHMFQSGRGNQGKTMWDAYNAVTEYMTWESGNGAATRFNSLWFGPNASRNVKAFDLALSMAT